MGVRSVFILFSFLQRTKLFFLNTKQPKCKTAKTPNNAAEHQRSSFFQPGPLRCSSAARLSSASVVCCCAEVGATSLLGAAWPTFSISPMSLRHSDTYRKGTCVNRWEMQSVKEFNWLTECDLHGGGGGGSGVAEGGEGEVGDVRKRHKPKSFFAAPWASCTGAIEYAAMLQSCIGRGAGRGGARIFTHAHRSLFLMHPRLLSVRAVVTARRSVETVAIFHRLCLSLPGNLGSMSRVPAGIITQQGHLSTACKHTHIRAGISRRDNELYLWSSRLKSTGAKWVQEKTGGEVLDCSCCIG